MKHPGPIGEFVETTCSLASGIALSPQVLCLIKPAIAIDRELLQTFRTLPAPELLIEGRARLALERRMSTSGLGKSTGYEGAFIKFSSGVYYVDS